MLSIEIIEKYILLKFLKYFDSILKLSLKWLNLMSIIILSSLKNHENQINSKVSKLIIIYRVY